MIFTFKKIFNKIIYSYKYSKLKREYLRECIYCNNKNFDHFFSKIINFSKLKIYKCKNCNLVFQNPRLKKESLSIFYDTVYRTKFDEKHLNNLYERGIKRGKYIYDFIFEKENHKINKIFEIGCGYGGILRYFKDRGYNVIGSEEDKNVIDFVLKKNIEIRQGELNVFLDNEKCDLIILSHILEHIYDPKVFLEKATKLLNPNGLIYIEVPGINNPRIIKRNYSIQAGHLYYFNKETLLNFINPTEFEVLRSNEVVQILIKKK